MECDHLSFQWLGDRSLLKAGCWFVGGDSFTEAWHVL